MGMRRPVLRRGSGAGASAALSGVQIRSRTLLPAQLSHASKQLRVTYRPWVCVYRHLRSVPLRTVDAVTIGTASCHLFTRPVWLRVLVEGIQPAIPGCMGFFFVQLLGAAVGAVIFSKEPFAPKEPR